MSEVHEAISAHSQKQHSLVTQFLHLDGQREYFIDEAVKLCQNKQPFQVEKINEVTKQINDLAKSYGYIPSRKIVTAQMVEEYANRISTQK